MTSTDLAAQLRAIGKLLPTDPAQAEARARAILNDAPGHSEATLLLAAAIRRQGDAAGAAALLEPLAAAGATRADIYQELGLACASLGRTDEAIAHLETAVARNPKLPSAWRALGDQHAAAGRTEAADAAYAQSIRASVNDPELMRAADALVANELAIAEPILRAHLKGAPTDVAAIRMLAELASRLGRYGDAEKLLARALELAPGFRPARHNYALVLHRQNRSLEAITQIDLLLADDPHNAGLANLKAAALGRLGDFADAIALYDDALARQPNQPKVWMSYGHALKTVGRQADSVDAYRRSIALETGLGEAWWSLANLKRVALTLDDRAAMGAALAGGLSDDDRFHLHFALGKAEEDAGDFAAAFEHYDRGNVMRAEQVSYDPAEIERHVARSTALFTPEFFASRADQGCLSPDPIFILGMPRAGSTLLEQILSSHSAIEGTMELPDIPQIAMRIGGRKLRSEESGGFYQRQTHDIQQVYKIDGLADFLSVPGWNDTIWLTKQFRIDRDYAVFGEASFDILDNLTLTGSLRYFKYDNTLTGFFGYSAGKAFSSGVKQCGTPLSQPTILGAPCTNVGQNNPDATIIINPDGTVDPARSKDDGLIHRLNLTYNITDDHMVYATWSRGFRPGGSNRRGGVAFLADFLTNYEVGFKFAMADGMLRWNAAAFQLDWDNFQFAILGLNGLTEIRNAASARIRGIESDIILQPADALTFTAGVTWLDTELLEDYCGETDSAGNPIITCAQPLAPAGTRLPASAEFKGNLTMRYEAPLNDDWLAHLQLAGVYQSAINSDLRTAERALLGNLDAYGTIDAALGFNNEDSGWSVEAYVTNLLDERGQASVYAQCLEPVCATDDPAIDSNVYTVPSQPRTFGLRIGYQY